MLGMNEKDSWWFTVYLWLMVALVLVWAALMANLDGVMQMLMGLVFVIAFLALYFTPTIVAEWRNHRNVTAIFVVNALLGWTIIAWALLLGWALLEQERRVR